MYVPPVVVERDVFARGGIVAGSHRGTMLLDNLDQASPDLQRRLAQFAEKRAIALDTRDAEAIDVRIIATIAEGRRGNIADQLYHRIAGVPLRMPPLSERRADIGLIFAHLLRQTAERLGCAVPQLDDAVHRLEARAWPGNIRELANLAERWCLGLEDEAQTMPPGRQGALPERLDAFERVAIGQALQDAKGEIASAITLLGVPRKTFYYRVKRLGLDLRTMRAAILEKR